MSHPAATVIGALRAATPRTPGQRGQGLVEYILIMALIVIVALVALSFFGTQLSDLLSTIASQINP